MGVAGLLLLEVPQDTLEVFIDNVRSGQPTGAVRRQAFLLHYVSAVAAVRRWLCVGSR